MTLRQHYTRAARAKLLYELTELRFTAIFEVILPRRARLHRGYKTWKACGALIEDVRLERLRKAIVLRCEARDRMRFDPHEEKARQAQRTEFLRRAS